MVFRTEHTVREIINKEVVSELETTVIIIEKKKKTGLVNLKPDDVANHRVCVSGEREMDRRELKVLTAPF